MFGGEDGKAGRHCFQHGIGNAFLVSVDASFARVQKNMRRIIDVAQFLRQQKARKRHPIMDLKFARQFLELLSHRTFSGNRQCRSRIMTEEMSERVQCCRQTFLLD